MTREVLSHYQDPLDMVWEQALKRIGLRLERSNMVFASSDGRGELTLGTAETLDADDCLAQMILHELCHSLVAGREGFAEPDWGLTQDDLTKEYACLRVQAALLDRYGLRRVLAPTTEHRAFYDGLDEPLDGPSEQRVLAEAAIERVDQAPWHPHLREALAATEAVVRALAGHAPRESIFSSAKHDLL